VLELFGMAKFIVPSDCLLCFDRLALNFSGMRDASFSPSLNTAIRSLTSLAWEASRLLRDVRADIFRGGRSAVVPGYEAENETSGCILDDASSLGLTYSSEKSAYAHCRESDIERLSTFSASVISSISLIVTVCSKSTESEERRCARIAGILDDCC
jgi:hypothetical protein